MSLVSADRESHSERVLGSRVETYPERRQHEHYEIDTELTARLLPHQNEVMHGYSLDISAVGIAGVFVTGWEVGTRVILEFCVPLSKERRQLQAIVRNRSGYRYGFEFDNLSGSQRAIIQKTCRVLRTLK